MRWYERRLAWRLRLQFSNPEVAGSSPRISEFLPNFCNIFWRASGKLVFGHVLDLQIARFELRSQACVLGIPLQRRAHTNSTSYDWSGTNWNTKNFKRSVRTLYSSKMHDFFFKLKLRVPIIQPRMSDHPSQPNEWLAEPEIRHPTNLLYTLSGPTIPV